jgi:tRNA pseudouridine55 synthase
MLGFVNLFKPAGPTSTQFGSRLRRIYGDREAGKLAVGHLGTLDPQAAGVLPIALGKATRLLPLIEDRRKSYVCTLVLGRSTDTGDATGATVKTTPVPAKPVDRLREAANGMIGCIEQIPPMYSAVHHEGRRLYALARGGVEVVRKPRAVTIYGLQVLGAEGARGGELAVRLRVACSEGTYVRVLCEDLGAAIGVAAHMGALLREGVGPFVLYDSRMLEEVAADPDGSLVPPEAVIALPSIVLDPRRLTDFRAGRIVPLADGPPNKHVFVRDGSHALVGIGETLGTLLAPRKVFL